MYSGSMLIFIFVLCVLLSYIFIFLLVHYAESSSAYALCINSLPIANTFHLSKRFRWRISEGTVKHN